MTTCTDTDRAHLARAIELAAQRRRARSSPTRSSAPWSRATARSWARAGTKSFGGAHAEVNAIEACGVGRSERRDAVRVARALLPRGQDAAVHRRDPAGRASGAWSSPPTTPPRRPPGAASGSCATRASRWSLADGELAARARLLNQAFRKHARVGRPWVLFKSAMTLDGKVATRTGDSQVDQRRGQPRAGPPLARVGRRGRRRHRHRARRRPAADGASRRPARRAAAPAAARRVRLARAPAAHLAARRRGRARCR